MPEPQDNTQEDITMGASEPHCGRTNCELRSGMSRLNEKVDRLLEAIYGNGQPGMKTRMALVELQQAGMRWFMRALFLIVLALIVKAAWSVLLRAGGG